MNDRAVSILENYDFTVLRTYKGRGAILCETDKGLKILKEYQAPMSKASLMNTLLGEVVANSSLAVDFILPNKDEKLISHDRDGVAYVVKDFFRGKECSPKEKDELLAAMQTMAKLHKCLRYPSSITMPEGVHVFDLKEELNRQNCELKRVRKFIRTRKHKNPFELEFLGCYHYFASKAEWVEDKAAGENFEEFYRQVREERVFSHGEYQYHNVMFAPNFAAVINFDKCQWDSRVRDVSLFLRKVLEKTDWPYELGETLLEEYEKYYPLSQQEKLQLFYRLSYPEKFRKIANFYFNSNKAFVSSQFLDKLTNVLRQEEAKEAFLHRMFFL